MKYMRITLHTEYKAYSKMVMLCPVYIFIWRVKLYLKNEIGAG